MPLEINYGKIKVYKNIEEIISNMPDEISTKIYEKIKLQPISEEVKEKSKGIGGLDNSIKKSLIYLKEHYLFFFKKKR